MSRILVKAVLSAISVAFLLTAFSSIKLKMINSLTILT